MIYRKERTLVLPNTSFYSETKQIEQQRPQHSDSGVARQ
jgi:hypothetical protein